ncbi:MAG: hypothetical protein GX335_10290 [Firmicutes bacterium]|nr:hypothetical protein [Bacillota bacterium]
MKRSLVVLLLLLAMSTAGFAAEKIEVDLEVFPYVELMVSTTSFNFDLPGNGGVSNLNYAEFSLRSNSKIRLSLESLGFRDFEDNPAVILNDFITYQIREIPLGAGQTWSGVVDAVGADEVFSWPISVTYTPGKLWSRIPAGIYRDKLVWTAAAVW